MNGLEEFKTKFPQAWDNFQKDSNLSSTAKDTFIGHLGKYKGGDIRVHAENFFFDQKNQLLGSKVVLHKNEVMGRVVNKSLFSSYIDFVYRATSKGTAPSIRASSSISTHILPPSDKKLQFLKRHLGDATLSNYKMWSFRNQNVPDEPFNNGIALTDIPCVLGLEGVAPPLFRLEYKVPHQTYVPTAFDAATNEAWRPGGRTYPLSTCRQRYPVGLPEIVHNPNRFRDLVKPLEEIK